MLQQLLDLFRVLLHLGPAYLYGRSSGIATQKAAEAKAEDRTAHAILQAVEAAPATVGATADSLRRGDF